MRQQESANIVDAGHGAGAVRADEAVIGVDAIFGDAQFPEPWR